VTLDRAGNLYGTTYRGGSSQLGTVYQLKRHGSSYVHNQLHGFAGGNDGGFLIYVARKCSKRGVQFQFPLSPPAPVPSAAPTTKPSGQSPSPARLPVIDARPRFRTRPPRSPKPLGGPSNTTVYSLATCSRIFPERYYPDEPLRGIAIREGKSGHQYHLVNTCPLALSPLPSLRITRVLGLEVMGGGHGRWGWELGSRSRFHVRLGWGARVCGKELGPRWGERESAAAGVESAGLQPGEFYGGG
jgi:uncharacterized repeat protein (TIGR03803 family)